jgi:uncharacterized protein (TIGR02266 family)
MADERRSARRAHIGGVRVTYESATGERVETVAQDLARGGLFVRTAKPLAVGKRLALEIQVVGEQGTWSALGRVVWIREAADGERPAGMGVKLIDIEDSVVAAIDRLVETRERTEPGVGAPSAPPAVPVAPRAPAMSIPIDLVAGRRAATSTAGEATATTQTAAGTDKRTGCGWSLVALGALAAGGAIAAYALIVRPPAQERAGHVPPPPTVAASPPTPPPPPAATPNDAGAATSAPAGSSAPDTSTPASEPSPKKPGSPPPSATGSRSAPVPPRRTENPY